MAAVPTGTTSTGVGSGPSTMEPGVPMAGLSPTEFASAVTAITSAFGDPTRREIYLYVHENREGVTASMAAKRFGLHANVTRHHLDKLAAGGYLEVSTERAPTGAGRPSKLYRAAAERVELDLPVRHDDVLITLLGRALAELGPERATELAEQVGESYGATMAESMGDNGTRGFRAALHTVADALSAHGFAAHAEKDGNKLRIVSENCPFGEAAVEHPVICAVDRGMVRGMLGTLYGETSVDVSSSQARGEDHCVTSVDN
ncbi:MAG: helix-turn-helix domain-containing protein [Microthrixaceae bacterium]|nr:helix-turn-helix domain-containing protein [Microthrixaceae bacterium]